MNASSLLALMRSCGAHVSAQHERNERRAKEARSCAYSYREKPAYERTFKACAHAAKSSSKIHLRSCRNQPQSGLSAVGGADALYSINNAPENRLPIPRGWVGPASPTEGKASAQVDVAKPALFSH